MTHTKQEEVEEIVLEFDKLFLYRLNQIALGKSRDVALYADQEEWITEQLTTLQRTTRFRALEEAREIVEDMRNIVDSHGVRVVTDGFVDTVRSRLIEAEKNEQV